MKIAYFSPLNPKKSGISDYSERLLPYLSKYGEVHIFVSSFKPSNPQILSNFKIIEYTPPNPPNIGDYEVIFYQIGNDSKSHKETIETLFKHPGIVILHDFYLQHLFAEMYIEAGKREEYNREMEYNYGTEGRKLAEQIAKTGFPLWETCDERYALSKRVIDCAKGIIVHSRYVRDRVRKTNKNIPIEIVPHLSLSDKKMVSEKEKEQLRSTLKLPKKTLLIASFGSVQKNRRLDKVLSAFARLKKTFPDLKYLIVGETPPYFDINRIIKEKGIDRNEIIETGRIERISDFENYLSAADIIVNLRYPTVGETSGVVIRALGLGKPVIVSNVGWYAELPGDSVIKIDVNEREEDELFEQLKGLVGSKTLRERLGRKGREYANKTCDPDEIAKEYLRFAQEVPQYEFINKFISELTGELKEMQLGEHEKTLVEVAKTVKEVGIF